ncbi:MAG: metal ABC transporter substrate-binding protein [Actinobacteria bacterium]|nr:metal ABC transporter substrate-binding protein [Actinomycetota bacterium]
MAGFYPVFEAARRVGGDRVSVVDLTPAGAEPHDLELDSRQVDRIEDADLVFYLDGGFQPGVERAVRRAEGEVVDVSNLGPSGPLSGVEGPGLIEGDPHVWLDPSLMARVVERIRAAYVKVDPASAPAYEARAQEYVAELNQLDDAFRRSLADCDRRVIVTAHAAFGYLARRYGLTQEAVAGLSPESEPDPGRLAQLSDMVRARGVTTIFYETLVSPKVAQALAREAEVRTAVLNPVEGRTDEEVDAGQTYLSLMRTNLTTLRSALGCR